MDSLSRSVVSLLLILILASCNLTSIDSFEMGKQFVSSDAGVVMIDTMKIETGTVKFDSIATSNLKRILLGNYSNDYTGKTVCNHFLEVSNGTFGLDDKTTYIYDSAVVRMCLDGYYMGDTTKLFKVKVKQIAQAMKMTTDGNLHNVDSLKVFGTAMGVSQFYPTPHIRKSFFLRLSDTWGKGWFDKIMAKNDTLSSAAYFKDYFKGIALLGDDAQNKATLGFNRDSVSLRIYYHRALNVEDTKMKFFFFFPKGPSDNWFNQIKYDPSGSQLNNILTSKNEVSSNLTGTNTMVQSGSAIYSKIRIPGVDNLVGYGKNVAFIYASLDLTPVPGTYSDEHPLPDSLAVYIVDHKNKIASQYSNSSGNVFARIIKPTALDKVPYYEVDVSTFFTSEMSDGVISDHSLLFGPTTQRLGQTVNPVVLSGSASKKDNIRLKVYCYMGRNN